MLYPLASHLSTLGARAESEENESEQDDECDEGDESEFEPLTRKETL